MPQISLSPKLPISVIIIAKNEAHNLPRALDSIKDIATEIIAIINDCTDNTQEVLEKYGAKVYTYPWEGFVVQKNRAIAYASQDWIFSLDADEEVTPRMTRDIQKFMEQDSQTYNAASFCRKSWFMGKWIHHGEWYPDCVVRLFNKNMGKFTGNYIHERLEINGNTRNFTSNLLHYSVPSLYTFLHKTESFTRNFAHANLNKKQFSYAGTIGRSLWKFIRCYFIKLGFLDGYPGLMIACQLAYSTFFRYSILLEHKTRHQEPFIENCDR